MCLHFLDDSYPMYDRLIEANKARRIYDQKKLENRVIIIKKRLIRQAWKQGMPGYKKVGMAFRYLPFMEAVKLLLSGNRR